jgi:hypothetical protein
MPPFRSQQRHDVAHTSDYRSSKLLEFAPGMWLVVSVSFIGLAIWFSLG